mgnify:FL=1
MSFIKKIKKMSTLSKIIAIAAIFLLCFLTINCQLVGYGIKQGIGQLKMVKNAIPIDTLLNDPKYPDSLKSKLLIIKEIRRFAIDSMHLTDSKNYTAVYDLQGRPTAYVVQACEKYAIKKYLWKFPIVGKLPYKGFFDETDAKKEAQKIKKQGYDVRIVNPGGWSTLGWFKDPVLSNMLAKDEPFLADLIIHELTHSTIFVKNDSELNENIADYVGENGAKYYLACKYGFDSEILNRYKNLIDDNEKYATHFLYGAKQLDSLYNSQSFKNITDTSTKNKLKRQEIEKIIEMLDTIKFKVVKTEKIKKQKLKNINNTFFTGYMTYHNRKNSLYIECKEKYNGDFLLHLESLKKQWGKN